MKVFTVLGARPQFIKAAVFSRLWREAGQEEVILHTGQHFDYTMSAQFWEEGKLPKPKYNLDIHSLPHGAMTGRMLEGIEQALLQEKPDLVLIYGDTNSTLAGALAAAKLQIPIAHVEAGLRSFNWAMPEEQNRVISDRISQYHFSTSAAASAQLVKEGLSPDGIFNVGDIMYDALLAEMQKPSSLATIPSGDFALLSLHRQENVDHDDRLAAWVSAINTLALKQKIVMPLHPRTKARLESLGLSLKVELMPPQNHRNLLELIKHSTYVLTDSGGMQKEAFYLGKHCFTLRLETEWRELVDLKVNHLVGPEALLQTVASCDFAFWPEGEPYGDGRTGERIVEVLLERFRV
jgi:UDP-GlcNAc3NAcA epimerase